jgi:hypothetical protein
MAEKISISISRIWTQSWTSFSELGPTTSIYGDVRVLYGNKLLPGFGESSSEGGAELNTAIRELIGFRDFADNDSYKTEFTHMSDIQYKIKRMGDVLQFKASYSGSPAWDILLTLNPGKEIPSIKELKDLQFSYTQVLEEVKIFKAKLRELLLANVSEEVAVAWWRLNAPGKLDEE